MCNCRAENGDKVQGIVLNHLAELPQSNLLSRARFQGFVIRFAASHALSRGK